MNFCTWLEDAPASPEPEYWLFESSTNDDYALSPGSRDELLRLYEQAAIPFTVQHRGYAAPEPDFDFDYDHPSLTAAERNPSLCR